MGGALNYSTLMGATRSFRVALSHIFPIVFLFLVGPFLHPFLYDQHAGRLLGTQISLEHVPKYGKSGTSYYMIADVHEHGSIPGTLKIGAMYVCILEASECNVHLARCTSRCIIV